MKTWWGPQFGYIWIDCKYKWVNDKACQHGALDFQMVLKNNVKDNNFFFLWWENMNWYFFCIVVTYEIHVFFEDAQKEVFANILKKTL